MNLIPVIREALGLEVNEEFHIQFKAGYIGIGKYRITKNCIEEIFENGWVKTDECVLNYLIKGEYEAVKIPFKPKESERYHFVSLDSGKLVDTYYYSDMSDHKLRVESGNCYRTQEEAEKHLDDWMSKVYGETWRDLLK